MAGKKENPPPGTSDDRINHPRLPRQRIPNPNPNQTPANHARNPQEYQQQQNQQPRPQLRQPQPQQPPPQQQEPQQQPLPAWVMGLYPQLAKLQNAAQSVLNLGSQMQGQQFPSPASTPKAPEAGLPHPPPNQSAQKHKPKPNRAQQEATPIPPPFEEPNKNDNKTQGNGGRMNRKKDNTNPPSPPAAGGGDGETDIKITTQIDQLCLSTSTLTLDKEEDNNNNNGKTTNQIQKLSTDPSKLEVKITLPNKLNGKGKPPKQQQQQPPPQHHQQPQLIPPQQEISEANIAAKQVNDNQKEENLEKRGAKKAIDQSIIETPRDIHEAKQEQKKGKPNKKDKQPPTTITTGTTTIADPKIDENTSSPPKEIKQPFQPQSLQNQAIQKIPSAPQIETFSPQVKEGNESELIMLGGQQLKQDQKKGKPGKKDKPTVNTTPIGGQKTDGNHNTEGQKTEERQQQPSVEPQLQIQAIQKNMSLTEEVPERKEERKSGEREDELKQDQEKAKSRRKRKQQKNSNPVPDVQNLEGGKLNNTQEISEVNNGPFSEKAEGEERKGSVESSSMKAVIPYHLPPGKETHCFLTHNWADGNHEKVSRINAGLKARGFMTWFDEEKMKGQVRQTMTEALSKTLSVIICITKIYESKVNGADRKDNCYFEFNYAANHSRLANKRLGIATEVEMSNPNNWNEDGRLFAELGGELIIDFSNCDDEVIFSKQLDALEFALKELLNLN